MRGGAGYRIGRRLYVPAACALALATGFLDLGLAMVITPIGWMLLYLGRAADTGRPSLSVPGLLLALAELGSTWAAPRLRTWTGMGDTKDLFALLLAANLAYAVLLALPATATAAPSPPREA